MRTQSIAVSCVRCMIFGLLAAASRVEAQELEPRAFSPNPTGVNYLVVGYSRSSGGVLFDPSVSVTDVDANFSAAAVGYGHTFGIFGRSATATLVTPYAWGSATGNVGEVQRSIERSGLPTRSFQVSVNLIGGPALSPAEFSKRDTRDHGRRQLARDHAHRTVRSQQAHQHRHQSLGIQAADWRLAAAGALGIWNALPASGCSGTTTTI